MSIAERQANIRIVLVNTTHPGNIGGAARAMKNMGLAELYLVQPREYPAPRAVWRAAGARDVLPTRRLSSLLMKLSPTVAGGWYQRPGTQNSLAADQSPGMR